MPKEYVVNGAKLECSQGKASSKLIVLPINRVMLDGKPKANISDCKPFVNVMPFGMCDSKTNPGVIAATAAAQGVHTPVPCTPTCSIWLGGKPNVLVGGMPALMKSDKAVCPLGAGKIQIKDSGQSGISVGAPPKPPLIAPSAIAVPTAVFLMFPNLVDFYMDAIRQWYLEEKAKLVEIAEKMQTPEGRAELMTQMVSELRAQVINEMLNWTGLSNVVSLATVAEQLMQADPLISSDQVIAKYKEQFTITYMETASKRGAEGLEEPGGPEGKAPTSGALLNKSIDSSRRAQPGGGKRLGPKQ